jgi:RNase H-fold protein (predicted Holliday junction resolvase)
VAVVAPQGPILELSVSPLAELGETVSRLWAQFGPDAIVIGDRTGHAEAVQAVRALPVDVPVHLIDERGSTLEGRRLYFECNPPRGWRRLLPLSLQTPPVPVDAYAAAVLARRFLARTKGLLSGLSGR